MKNLNRNDVLVAEKETDNCNRTTDLFSKDDLPFSIIAFQTKENSAETLFENIVCTGSGKIPAPEALMIDIPASGWNYIHLLSEIYSDDDSDHIPVIVAKQ
ncbi:MAG: hypothetical protein JXJ04_02875 [Spirochaetales bacterium]|nr:hypothetical protein [Spirochaetales bacterium]